MIRLSVFYPATEGATFDHDHYREKHVPLCTSDIGKYPTIGPVLQTSEIVD